MLIIDIYLNYSGPTLVTQIPRDVKITEKMCWCVNPDKCMFTLMNREDYEEKNSIISLFGDNYKSEHIGDTCYVIKYNTFHEIVHDDRRFMAGPALIIKDDKDDPLLNEKELEEARSEYVKRLAVIDSSIPDNLRVVYKLKQEEK